MDASLPKEKNSYLKPFMAFGFVCFLHFQKKAKVSHGVQVETFFLVKRIKPAEKSSGPGQAMTPDRRTKRKHGLQRHAGRMDTRTDEKRSEIKISNLSSF